MSLSLPRAPERLKKRRIVSLPVGLDGPPRDLPSATKASVAAARPFVRLAFCPSDEGAETKGLSGSIGRGEHSVETLDLDALLGAFVRSWT